MSVLASYPFGSRPSVTGTFTPRPGDAAVVTAVSVQTKSPRGDRAEYNWPGSPTLVEDEDNVLTFTFPNPLEIRGEWVVEFEGTAGIIHRDETRITIRKTSFP